MKSGVFATMELDPPARDQVLAVQRWADPRMAGESPPHVTMVGSSGAGPMPPGIPAERIRELIEPITASTAPVVVQLERPHRFMQTDIVVLPISPHGALRTLHERIRTCGLPFEQPRFPFSPHVTLSFYPTLTPEMERKLMQVRVDDPVRLESIKFWLTIEPQAPRLLLELTLDGRLRTAN